MSELNGMCDGSHCKTAAGEVRVLPLGGGANLILCRACHRYELEFRRERNVTLGDFAKFALPAWETLEVYEVSP